MTILLLVKWLGLSAWALSDFFPLEPYFIVFEQHSQYATPGISGFLSQISHRHRCGEFDLHNLEALKCPLLPQLSQILLYTRQLLNSCRQHFYIMGDYPDTQGVCSLLYDQWIPVQALNLCHINTSIFCAKRFQMYRCQL